MATAGQIAEVNATAKNNLQYGMGTYSAGGEQVDFGYYDTILIPATTGIIRMFQEQQGVGGKNLSDTNMITSGMIPKAQKLIVKAVKVFLSPATAASSLIDAATLVALYALMKSTTVEFNIANKYTFGQWTLQELMGPAMLVAVEESGEFISQPQPSFRGIIPLNNNVILSENTNFEIRVQFHETPSAYLADMRLCINLYGVLSFAT